MIDDHLELLDRSFAGVRLVVFTGMSGSGKTTCIDLLQAEHPEFADQPCSRIGPAPIDWDRARVQTELVVIDELLALREVGRVVSLLRRGHRVIAASHLPVAWVRAVDLVWKTEHFHTDRTYQKLVPYLDRRGVRSSPDALREYAASFGANYTDLDIILAHTGYDDFDRALARFQQTASIEILT